MYCRNIYCNSLRTLRYWHLNIPTVTITTSFVLQEDEKLFSPLLHDDANNRCNTTNYYCSPLTTDSFFIRCPFLCSILVHFLLTTTIYTTLLSTLIKETKKYANNLNVDQVTSLANYVSFMFCLIIIFGKQVGFIYVEQTASYLLIVPFFFW